MRILQFLCLSLWFCAVSLCFGLGETRLFQFRDPLKAASSPDRITAFNAINRLQKTIRPGWELRMFVEEGIWASSSPMGLDSEDSISEVNRLAVLEQFAETMRQIILTMESLATSFKVPANPSLDGINFVFLDMQDGFSSDPAQDERKGSYFASRFDPLDQVAASGLNRMNLIYIDLNPGTLSKELVLGINRKKTWQEAVRSLGRLILYQQNAAKEAWIQEGYAQYILYRLLKQRPFPGGQELILNVPSEPVSEVNLFIGEPLSVYAGFATDPDLLDRVFVEKTPRDLMDNVRNSQLRGFAYLFFTYLFHRMGGSFETTNTSGDEFFRNLAQDSRTGLVVLGDLIAARGFTLGSILEDFYQSLIINTQESRFQIEAANFSRLKRSQFPILDGPGIQLELQLQQYQAGMANLLGGGLNSTRNVLFRPAGGLGNSSVLLFNRDSRGVEYAEQNLSARARLGTTQTIEEIQIPLYQAENKLVLVINQQDNLRQFNLSVPTLDTVTTRSVVLLASNQEFGSVTTAIEIETGDLPTGTTTKAVNVSISGAGLFEITVTNLSDSSLSWSLGANAPATGLALRGYSPLSFSLGSTMASSSDRRIFQASRSSLKLLLIHEVATSRNFSLAFELVPNSLISTSGSGSGTVTNPPVQTEEEFLRIAGGGGGGCFVATAAFGNKDAFSVRILSRFRDKCLLKTKWGREIVQWYYVTSPPIAEIISEDIHLRRWTQILLLPLIGLALMGLVIVEGGIVLFIMLMTGLILKRQWIGMLLLVLFATTRVSANSGVQTALTTAQIQDIGSTFQSIASNAFRYFGAVQPAFSNPEDNTLNVVLYDILDGSNDPAVQIGSYFSPIDQLRVPSLSDRNRQSNFGNVLYVDLNPLNPLLSRSALQTQAAAQISTASLYANQQIFYQRFSRSLSKLIQFQKQNPKDQATVKSLFEQGFWLEDDRWLTEALAIFGSFRFPRGNEIVFNADSALKVFENNQPLGDLIMDSRLGTQGPLEVGLLLHYPLGQPWPSLFFGDKLASGVMGPLPSLLTQNQSYQLQASYGLGFMTLLYFWEQLTTEGRARVDRVEDLGDRFIRALLSGPTTKNIATGRALPTYVTTGVINPCSAPFNSSRVCAIEGVLLNLGAERCQTRRTRTCFEQFFLDMGLAMFVDQPPLTGYNGAQKYEIRNLDFRAMDIENNRLNPNLSVGNRAGIDFSITDSLFDDYNRETAQVIDGEVQVSADQSTEATSISGVNISEFGLSFIGLANRNTKADVDYVFTDGVDFLTDGRLDCSPVSVMSRLYVGTQSSRTVTCPNSPGTTVFSVPKASGIGESSTGVAVFAGLGDSRLELATARVSQGSAVTMEPVPTPPVLPMIRTGVHQTSGVLASVSGIEKFKDKKVIETVDRLDPNAVQQFTHSFRTINFATSNLNSLIVEERTAVLKYRAEIQSSDGVPMELLVWVDQNFLPAEEVSSRTTVPTNVPSDVVPALEQIILLGTSAFQNTKEILQSVNVPGRTTMVLRVQNQTASSVNINFTPCNQLNECGGVPSDYFEIWCDSDISTPKPDCAGLGNINEPRSVGAFQTLVLPLRNKNSESSQLLSFLKPSGSISRSDNNAVSVEGSGKSGCFIASAAFGNPEHQVVQKFIQFRDQVLLHTKTGQLFVALYYEFSPVIADFIGESATLRFLTMGCLWMIWSFLVFPWLWVLTGMLMVSYRLLRLCKRSAVSSRSL